MILRRFPPMGIYETLFMFAQATGRTMGGAGTDTTVALDATKYTPYYDVLEVLKRTSDLDRFIRFSFGPLLPECYETDMTILAQCLGSRG